jgi:Cyclic nucleotide-binding domain
VAFKRWFKGAGGGQGLDEVSIEDLIVLERYDEAEERLKARLKVNPADLHSHLKLADVYTALRQVGKAVEEYLFAAEEYAQDGFYDKGLALLSRAQKLLPADESLRQKILAYQGVKGLEHKRAAAVDGLRQGRFAASAANAWSLQIQRYWYRIATSPALQRLPDDQVVRLFSAVEVVTLPKDAVLAWEGDPGGAMFLVVNGVIAAGVDDAGVGGACVRTFSSRDILGERAMFERQPWPATYRVTEPALLIKLDREGLEHALVGNPDPRRFLDALRGQGSDREVAAMVAKLRATN